MTSPKQGKVIPDLAPLTRRTTIHGCQWENPRMQEGGWSTPAPQTPRQSASQRKEEWLAAHWAHCTSPRVAQHQLERCPLNLWFLRWEKNPGVISSPPNIVGHFMGAPQTLVLPNRDHREIGGAQLLRISSWWRMREKFTATSTWILGDWAFTCRVQLVVPTSSFTHLQNQVGGAVWPGNSVECRSAWFGPSKEEFCQSWSLVCPHSGRRAES